MQWHKLINLLHEMEKGKFNRMKNGEWRRKKNRETTKWSGQIELFNGDCLLSASISFFSCTRHASNKRIIMLLKAAYIPFFCLSFRCYYDACSHRLVGVMVTAILTKWHEKHSFFFSFSKAQWFAHTFRFLPFTSIYLASTHVMEQLRCIKYTFFLLTKAFDCIYLLLFFSLFNMSWFFVLFLNIYVPPSKQDRFFS